MSQPHRPLPLIAAFGVLASGVTLAAATASTASATPPGNTSGNIAFSPGTSPAPGNVTFGSGMITAVAPDGTSHTWQPAGTGDGPSSGSGNYLTGLAYSPDGTKIAYTVDHASVWVSNADGTDDHIVITGGLYAGNTIGGGYSANTVQWSPDGQYIYYLHVTQDTHSVRRVRPNSTGEQTLFTAPGGGAFSFSVSPAGDIATDVLGAGGQPSISIWHAATNVVSATGITGYEPDFSPDGASLLYTTNGQGLQTLYTAKADGTDQHLVAGEVEAESKPVWSPDGTAIAYGTMSGVMEYFPATSSSKQIASVTGATNLTWQPHAVGAAPAMARTIDRVGGADRIDTAVDASGFEFAAAGASGRQAKAAVLSRSDTYADALAGSALAAAKTGPLLLTSGSGLDARVRSELHRVLPAGSTVYLLGGDSALSPAVEQAVRDAGYTPKRLSGSDRYATSLAIAQEITPNPTTVLVATGNDYPDALGAGAYAGAHANAVVVLSAGTTLTPQVRSYVAGAFANPDARVLTVGGPGGQAVDSAFSPSFRKPLSVTRFLQLGGSDRYETAAELATLNGNHDIVALATGSGWADALAGGAVAGLNGAPLFLTHGTAIDPTEEHYWSQTSDPKTGQRTGPENPIMTTREIIAFGGPAVIPDRDIAAHAAATGQGGWTTQVDRSAPPLP